MVQVARRRDHGQIPREKAPCGMVAECRDVLVVPDFEKDGCYRDSHLARSGIRFYAGAPLVTREGHGLGAMCVLGTEPREATEEEVAALRDLAAMVMAQIELQHALGRIDPLSGLPNRNQFIEDVEDLARDHPGERRFAVLVDLLDVAQHAAALRAIGPSFTDDMVRASTRRLRTALGPAAKVYQIGTTHLGYLLPDMDDGAALAVTDGVRARIGAVIASQGAPVTIRTAIGVAPFRLGAAAPQDVLRTVHSAAQDAREAEAGVRVYSASLDEAHRRRFQLLADFPDALAADDQLRSPSSPALTCGPASASGRKRCCAGVTRPGRRVPGRVHPDRGADGLARDVTEWVAARAVPDGRVAHGRAST
jgi:GGDEF domain-containing protein